MDPSSPQASTSLDDGRLLPRDWAMVAAFAAAGFLLRYAFATQRGFWLDEYYTLQASRMPFNLMLEERLAAGHSPLPFLYAKLFRETLGEWERMLRLSSILAAAVATFGLAGWIGQMRLRTVLLPAMALTLLSPYWFTIGTEFRYMMPLVTCCAFWFWGMAAYWQRPGWRRGLLATLAGTLTLYVHGSAQLVLFGMVAVGLLLRFQRTPDDPAPARGWVIFAPLAAALAGVVPLLLALGTQREETSTGAFPDPSDVFRNQISAFFSDGAVAESLTGLGPSLFRIVYMLLYAVALYAAWSWLRRARAPLAGRFLAGLLVGSALGFMAVSALGENVQSTLRYAAPLSLPVIVVLAIGWDEAQRWAWWGLAWRSTFAVLATAMLLLEVANQGVWMRQSIQHLAAIRQPDQPVMVVTRDMNILAMRHHVFPWEGVIWGVESTVEDPAEVARELAKAYRIGDADSGFLLQYRGDREIVDAALDRLRAEGLILAERQWTATSQLRLFAFAFRQEGRARIEALPDLPKPFLTDDPI